MKNFKDLLSEVTNDVPKIEAEIASFFRKKTNTVQKEDHAHEGKNAVGAVSSRHWGSWEVPDGEEDDGDYDWEVLTKKSSDELKKFVDELKKKYKKFDFRVSGGEKNWLTIVILNKK